MEVSNISSKTSDLISKYSDFTFGNAVCTLPYFNNKTIGKRAALAVEAGKGSPEEIFDEIKERAIRKGLNSDDLTNESLKRFLVDNSIGVDCSGFAFYILNEESISRGKKELKEYLKFPFNRGFLGLLKSKFRIVENAGVKTFAHDYNSHVVETGEVRAGDFISMIGNDDSLSRDHILVVTKVEYENSLPKKIFYVHFVAWPTDGEYGHGYHEGMIEVEDASKNISEQKWIELGKLGDENYTFTRAKKSKTEIRRLNWFD